MTSFRTLMALGLHYNGGVPGGGLSIGIYWLIAVIQLPGRGRESVTTSTTIVLGDTQPPPPNSHVLTTEKCRRNFDIYLRLKCGDFFVSTKKYANRSTRQE